MLLSENGTIYLTELRISCGIYSVAIIAYGERNGANLGGAGSRFIRRLGKETEFLFDVC